MEQKYTDLLQKAAAWIEAHKEEFISEIQGLVRIPSVSRQDLAEENAPFGPDCRKVLDYFLERGRFYGFDAEDLQGCAGAITFGDKENSLGVIAHLDVVPVGEGWVYPPFGATYLPEYDVIIGRGAGDNKGPAVAGLFALRMLRDFHWPLRHGLRLIGGMSEETGMQDMEMLREKGFSFPRLSLVPDARFPVNFAQKGSIDSTLSCPCTGNLIAFDAGSVRNVIPDLAECTLTLEIEKVKAAFACLPEEDLEKLELLPCEEGTHILAHGKAGHAAAPALSDNAIARLSRALTLSGILEGDCKKAMAELCALSADGFGESEGVSYRDEESGELTLVYSVAHLEKGVLSVLTDCRFSISLNGETLENNLKKDWQRRGFSIPFLHRSNPFYLPKEDPRVIALQQLYQEVTGREDPPYAMGGGTYSRAVPRAISFGPGIPGKGVDVSAFLPEGHGGGHGRDEALSLEAIRTCCQIYTVALAMLDEIED